MLAEYLKHDAGQTIMPGISVCNYTQDMEMGSVPVVMEYAHAEVFFCVSGSLMIHINNGTSLRVDPREILLLSDCSRIRDVEVAAPLEGMFLSIHQLQASECFRDISHYFGNLPLSMKRVAEFVNSSGGFRVIPGTLWSRSAFYALKHLPREDQASYTVMKTYELLYLLGNQSTDAANSQQERNGNMMTVAAGMKRYMEEHMDEKLTITELSHQFHLSRTVCKSCFRSCYGQPIHSWLLDRRMEHAAELLEHTKMPILQVAQSVGYTGVSQFNVAFRQRYGKSPREYRKMSVSNVF